MQNCKTTLITTIVALLGVLLIGGASTSLAQITVNCSLNAVLQDAIDNALPNETILVLGRCRENIRIDHSKRGLTIDGQGTARIIAADDTMATVSIFGRGITIQNFRIIRGGANGIRLSDSASATIKNNNIRRASGQGIRVEGNSFATIIGNIVRRHGVNGISILESSSAEIGTDCSEDDLNIIARNGQSGIALSRNAQASIRGNIIRNNAANGIFVSESSTADTASNVITGNGGDGIDVRLGSSVRLGRRNAADSCGNNPNSTNPNNLNAGIGIDCQNLSTVDGVLGSLNGANGAANLRDDNSDCPDCCFASIDLDTPPANEAPEAAFSFETDGLTVNFTDESTDSDGSVVAWAWSLGDGEGTSTEQNPSYTYAEAGTYIVSLTVTDDQDEVSERAIDFVEVSAPTGDVFRVFVTSTVTLGGFGGLGGGDQICQSRADAAQLGGKWTAWLSDDNTDAIDRITDGQYELLDGTVIADDKDDLDDGMLNAAINLSENEGAPGASNVWTGTLPDGTKVPPDPNFDESSNCSNWTSSDQEQSCTPGGDDNCAARGNSAAFEDGTWTLIGTPGNPSLTGCSVPSSLYCFEVPDTE